MVEFTSRLVKAINLAAQLHKDQRRKADPDIPFIVHPFSVAFIVSQHTSDEDVIIAALFHDVLEDVKKEKYSDRDLIRDFGERVYKVVKGVSEQKDANISREEERRTWRQRKQKYIDILKKESKEALLVACADKIHNLYSLLEAYKRWGGRVWENFNAPDPKKENYIWYYEEMIKVLDRKLKNKRIVAQLKEVFKQARTEIFT
ncbi:HD domain-containing protein [Candidatus Roizmanbacteria bacterium]|nr:HD domain-containing protein [Candidatus Roizmanbacteria bacterium]